MSKRSSSSKQPSGKRRGSSSRSNTESEASNLPSACDFKALRGKWPSVEDNERHLVQSLGDEDVASNYQLCGAPKSCCGYYERAANNARVMSAIEATNWNYFCSVPEANHDHKVVLSLIERWWDTTHTFHLPAVELGFTPYDFTCLTGIVVGAGPDAPYDRDSWRTLEAVQRYFPHASKENLDLSGIRCTFLKSTIASIVLPAVQHASTRATDAEEAIEDMWLRAFFLLVIGEIFFPLSKKYVSFGWLEALDDVHAVGQYDWGTAIMAQMYRGLDDSSRGKVAKGQFCWTVLEYWYYEYIRLPAPVLMSPVDDVFPRMLRWAPQRTMGGVGAIAHLLSVCRRKLEEATQASICWRPFADSQLIAGSPFCRHSLHISTFRTILAEQGTYMWYLGDRCWRQLTGQPSIPCPPPTPMSVTAAAFRSWTQAPQPAVPVAADAYRMDASESDWSVYWAHVSHGVRLGLRHRHVNVDEVNVASSYDHRLRPTRPRGVVERQGDYETPQMADLSDCFRDMSIAVPGTSRELRTPTLGWTPFPEHASPEDYRALSHYYYEIASHYRVGLQRTWDIHGYPSDSSIFYPEGYTGTSEGGAGTGPSHTSADVGPSFTAEDVYRPTLDTGEGQGTVDDMFEFSLDEV